jgi:UDP-N-acetylglucosamine--N-acetylmuramyl-(pentapeptide) pyrophosphoryl-undecaprenol N-acetylglucosamine transferase
MRIIFCGGGTMGPVTPLIAVKEALDNETGHEFLWIGTKKGPEKSSIEEAQIVFKTIPCGKWRRYLDWRNFTDPFWVFLGFLKSLWLIWRFKPDVILTAGGFVCVPVAYAAALMRKKIVVHQQDLRIGLANKIMLPIASLTTLAFEELADDFSKRKIEVTGNPVRRSIFAVNREQALINFGLSNDLPVVLVMGGGIGSEVINKIFIEASRELTMFCQVIHVVGKGEQSKWLYHPQIQGNLRYRIFEFLTDELADAYSAANLVVCRGGLATLTELSALKKSAIVIPIPKNQQVDNAEFFKKHQAIVYVRQDDLEKDYLVELIRDLLEKEAWRRSLSENIYKIMPQNAATEYVRILKNLTIKKSPEPVDRPEEMG